ncbi:hybrid sensor histidine kinase/response regulator [Massilia sp. 9096]|uniref:hybrid sensor histidine kinase/response regulator n=1 Tax=Massilia sp. 9096 TaxID=1500894 RepID=UPI000567891B|nr:hybrid sensor histidine kinase/response regulator [Massilia sp. 9096]
MSESRRSQRIVVAIGTALLLTICAAFSYSVYHARESEEQEWSSQLDNTSLLLAEQTAHQMQAANLVLEGMLERIRMLEVSNRDELRERLSGAAEFQRLVDRKRAVPDIDVATVLDEDGDVVNITRRFPTPQLNLAERDFFVAQRDSASRGLYVSKPVRNKSNNEWTFYLTRRIEAPDGRFLGVVMVGLSPLRISEGYSKINLGKEASVTLYRSDFTVMARWPHIDNTMGMVNNSGVAYEVLGRRKLDHGVTFMEGPRRELQEVSDKRIGAARVIPQYPLMVAVCVTESLYLRQWREYAWQLAGAGLACLLAVCAALSGLLHSMRKHDHALEEQARLKAEADAANRAKSDFLAMMSHEIRTPLTAVIGFAEFLQRASTDPESAEFSAIIVRNGQHLLSLINDILDMSKIESGKLVLEQVPFAPSDAAAAAVSSLQGQAEARGIGLGLHFDGPLPSAALGDPTRWRQILLNLVSNAVKFTERGAVSVHLAYRGEDAMLVCTVRDSGIGMSPDQVERLFKPFEQADSSVMRRFGGTGLGLHLVQRLAAAMGGTVGVDSTLGQGTTMTVAVHAPLAHGATLLRVPSVGAIERVAAPPQLSGRVLLVEDGMDNRLLIGALLQGCGLEVIHAEDGEEGVRLAESSAPDLILMDIQMPRLDGVSALHRLRARGWTRPAIALTANVLHAERKRYLEAGFDACLAKPIDRAGLYALLARHLSALQPA